MIEFKRWMCAVYIRDALILFINSGALQYVN